MSSNYSISGRTFYIYTKLNDPTSDKLWGAELTICKRDEETKNYTLDPRFTVEEAEKFLASKMASYSMETFMKHWDIK